MYCIVEGTVRVVCSRGSQGPLAPSALPLGVVGPGQWFGEKPLVAGTVGVRESSLLL